MGLRWTKPERRRGTSCPAAARRVGTMTRGELRSDGAGECAIARRSEIHAQDAA